MQKNKGIQHHDHHVRKRRINILLHHLQPRTCDSPSLSIATCSASPKRRRKTTLVKEYGGTTEFIHIRDAFERIINMILDIYFIIEEEEIETLHTQKKSARTRISDWMSAIMPTSSSPNGEPFDDELPSSLYLDRKRVLANQLKDLPVLPFYTQFLTDSAEVSLKVITGLSILSLVGAAEAHKAFQFRVKPFLIYYSLLLDIYIRKKFTNLNRLSNLKRKLTVQFLHFVVLLRRKSPNRYYQLLSIYLHLSNIAALPKKSVQDLLWFIAAVYFHMTMFSMYLIQKSAPSVQSLLEKSWKEMYQLAGTIVLFVRSSPVHAELN